MNFIIYENIWVSKKNFIIYTKIIESLKNFIIYYIVELLRKNLEKNFVNIWFSVKVWLFSELSKWKGCFCSFFYL